MLFKVMIMNNKTKTKKRKTILPVPGIKPQSPGWKAFSKPKEW